MTLDGLNQMSSMLNSLKQLWCFVSPKRKQEFKSIIFLMVVAAFIEVLSLGAVIPFLAILSDSGVSSQNLSFAWLSIILGVASTSKLTFTLLFCFLVALSGLTRAFVLWASCNFSHNLGADLSDNIFRNILYQPYETHLNDRSSQIISAISTKTDKIIHEVVSPLMVMFSSGLILSAVLICLIAFNAKVFFLIFFALFLPYIIFSSIVKKFIFRNGEIVSENLSRLVKMLQHALGGIRNIILDGIQEHYISMFSSSNKKLRDAQSANQFFASVPRYFVESIGTILIVLIAFYLISKGESLVSFIPFIGLVVLGLQRLLPLLQQSYNAWANFKGSQSTLDDLLFYLTRKIQSNFGAELSIVNFEHHISLKNVSFRYDSSSSRALEGVNLEIPKGVKIGIIGKTGSGKSTLVDVIMGLLKPTSGDLLIDGKSLDDSARLGWQKRIAHVPQQVYLSDVSVMENIAFGFSPEKIDPVRVKRVAEAANISRDIDCWDLNYQTLVGEGGGAISGGQKQRIAIARALYKEADVFVLDEATSALDSLTEKDIMDHIKQFDPDVTVIMITHRLSTLSFCDFVVHMEHGSVKKIGSYEQIIADFQN
jgi:ABC-type bacteriocin/lantibiotic exporter with double-glycine peptidase domain